MDYFLKKKSEFRVLRLLVVILVVVFLGVFAAREVFHYRQVQGLTGKIWAFDPRIGSVVAMEKIPFTMEERKKEYEHHVCDFLKHWFAFDQYTFLDHMDYARNLIDKESFDREISKYREENTLGVLQERDIIVTIGPPTVYIDSSKHPFAGTFSITQIMRTRDNQRKRIIEGEFTIEDTQGRSSKNPHAAMIYNYVITRKEIME